MKKGALMFCIFFGLIFSISQISAASVQAGLIKDEIKKLSHYAEDYESGNLNYMQFLTYLAETKQNINT